MYKLSQKEYEQVKKYSKKTKWSQFWTNFAYVIAFILFLLAAIVIFSYILAFIIAIFVIMFSNKEFIEIFSITQKIAMISMCILCELLYAADPGALRIKKINLKEGEYSSFKAKITSIEKKEEIKMTEEKNKIKKNDEDFETKILNEKIEYVDLDFRKEKTFIKFELIDNSDKLSENQSKNFKKEYKIDNNNSNKKFRDNMQLDKEFILIDSKNELFFFNFND